MHGDCCELLLLAGILLQAVPGAQPPIKQAYLALLTPAPLPGWLQGLAGAAGADWKPPVSCDTPGCDAFECTGQEGNSNGCVAYDGSA